VFLHTDSKTTSSLKIDRATFNILPDHIGDGFLQVKRRNQQYQSTEGRTK